MIYCLFRLLKNCVFTDDDKLLSSKNFCTKFNALEFKRVTKIIFKLEYDEEPNYDKIKFEFIKILLRVG